MTWISMTCLSNYLDFVMLMAVTTLVSFLLPSIGLDQVPWNEHDLPDFTTIERVYFLIRFVSNFISLAYKCKTCTQPTSTAARVVETAVGEPLGLGYGALRRREIALGQPTLTTWIDLENGIAYFDVLAYPPSAPPVQTPPSPEWSFGLLPVSPAPSIVPLPISSPMISLTVLSPVASPATAEVEGFLTDLGAQVEMQGELIHDHMVRSRELSPALFERYDRDIGELFTRSGAVRDEIFFQIYLFRSLEHEQERVAIAEERHARLDLAEVVDSMRRGQEPRGDV
ncbi:hypothetical protein Tco_0024448 [Tanacetum coccineum]